MKALDFLWDTFQCVANPKPVVPFYITPNYDALQSDYKAMNVGLVCFLWSRPNPRCMDHREHCLDLSS